MDVVNEEEEERQRFTFQKHKGLKVPIGVYQGRQLYYFYTYCVTFRTETHCAVSYLNFCIFLLKPIGVNLKSSRGNEKSTSGTFFIWLQSYRLK